MGNLSREQIKSAAMEIHGDLEMVAVPEPAGPFLYGGILEFKPSATALVMRCSK